MEVNVANACITCLTRDKEVGPYCRPCYEQYIKPMEKGANIPQEAPAPTQAPAPQSVLPPITEETYSEYSLELGDGRTLEAKIGDRSGSISAVVLDMEGNASTPKTFADIDEFKKTVSSMKDQIQKEKEYVESVKSAVDGLGFVSK